MRFLFFVSFFGILLGGISLSSADPFSLSETGVNFTANDGNADFFQLFSVTNNQNNTIFVETSITGDSPQLVFLPRNITVGTNTTQQVSVSSVVPISAEPKIYRYTANFTALNVSKFINISVNVNDRIKPTINSCVFSSPFVNRTRTAEVKCDISDNYQIGNAVLLIDALTVNMSLKDGRYVGRFVLNEQKEYNSTVFVNDSNYNSANITMPILTITSFIPMSTFDIDFLHIRLGTPVSRQVGVVYDAINSSVQLNEARYPDSNITTPISVDLILSDGTSKSLAIGNKTELGNIPSGIINLRINGQTFGKFRGSLDFFFGESSFHSSFKGEFANYSVLFPTNFTWFNTAAYCYGVDTGFLENSSTICQLTLPITDNINSSSLPPPFSVDFVKKLGLENFQNTLLELQHKREGENLYFWAFIILMIIFGCVELFRYLDEKEDK